jgi:hypothetical protein
MPTIDDETTFFVLNGSHLKKMATADEIAAAVGVSLKTAQKVLSTAVERGWAMDANGKYLLLPAGTAEVHRYYAISYAPLRSDPEIVSWYKRFELLNDQFIKAVSDWQESDGDPKAQTKVIKTVERLAKALREILAKIPRYGCYARRLADGVVSIDRGETEFICSPTIDSVHTIWFEFHEDILSVLGRPRDV